MRRGLVDAMKARDQQAVAALRATLAAIDNAEAVDAEVVDADLALDSGDGHPAVAGSVAGIGAAEVDRRILTPEETAAIVRGEVTEREAAAEPPPTDPLDRNVPDPASPTQIASTPGSPLPRASTRDRLDPGSPGPGSPWTRIALDPDRPDPGSLAC